MREITKYLADDGKEFKNKRECLDHEAAVSACRRVGKLKHPQHGAYLESTVIYSVILALCKAGFEIVDRLEQPEASG